MVLDADLMQHGKGVFKSDLKLTADIR